MSFSFGFTSEDLDKDETVPSTPTVGQELQDQNSAANPLDSETLLAADVIQPGHESLESVLNTLKDVRISFEQVDIPQLDDESQLLQLYRRDLFDMKHQLMSEDNDVEETGENELEILINEDLRKNIYEGGLKSWECSTDLVRLLSKSFLQDNDLSFDNINCVVELGCGTALPSEYIFSEYLRQGRNNGLKLVLADYNTSALRLATVPNMVLAWANATLTKESLTALQPENVNIRFGEELMLSEPLLEAFYADIAGRNVTIDVISGSWGRKFSNMLHTILESVKDHESRNMLVLTSETIYQPEHLPVISETVIDLQQNSKFAKVNSIVAAKDIYFGVGGSLIEFERYLTKRGIEFNTRKINSGLKRSIVLIQ